MTAAIELPAPYVAVQDEGMPADEAERLACLHRLGLLDTAPAEPFDARRPPGRRRRFGYRCCWSRWSTNIVSGSSRASASTCAKPRAMRWFCSQVVLQRQPLVVRDATLDPRFAKTPLVSGAAAHALLSWEFRCTRRDRQPVGTLCALDTEVRDSATSSWWCSPSSRRSLEEFLCAKELAAKADGVLQYAMEREKLFRETFEQAAVGIVHTSLSGTILRINQRACAVLGYTPGQLRELSFLELTHPEDLPKNVSEFKRALARRDRQLPPRAAPAVQGSALPVELAGGLAQAHGVAPAGLRHRRHRRHCGEKAGRDRSARGARCPAGNGSRADAQA